MYSLNVNSRFASDVTATILGCLRKHDVDGSENVI